MAGDVILYDGVCGLCDRFVQFVLDRDAAARFRFAPLQGAFAQAEVAAHGRKALALDTVYVLTTEGRLLDRSDAVLFVFAALGGGWRVLAFFRFLPRPLRDAAYRLVARVRHRLVPKLDACRLPSAAERARFIES